jgi:dTMP kinase
LGSWDFPDRYRPLYDIPAEAAIDRLKKRTNETGDRGDIHERDETYLRQCRVCGEAAADYYGWRKIRCYTEGVERAEQEIHEEIHAILTQIGRLE